MLSPYEQYLKQADNLANQGKFDEALEQYVHARNADPSRSEARKQIINMSIKKEDFGKTFQEYISWADFMVEHGKHDETLKILHEALALEGQYEKRGFLRDRRSAASSKLKEHFQKYATQLYERFGQVYYEKKDYNNAVDYFLKVIETTPNNTKAHCLLGICYFAKGLLDKAKGSFQEVVRFQGPEAALAYEKLAEIYSSQGNTTQMVIWLKDAAEAYIKKDQWDSAVKVLERILQIEPGSKEILTHLGEIYAKQGNTKQAVQVYKQLAEVYAQTGIFDKVIVLYEKLVEWEPEEPEIINRVIEIYRTSLQVDPGNLRARIKLIENLLRKGSVDEVIVEYLQLIDDYVKIGLLDEAVNCCEKVLEFEPNQVKAREKLADLYMKVGRKEDAGRQFITLVETMQAKGDETKSTELIQKAMGLLHEKSEVYLIMGNDLLRRGMIQEAVVEFENILKDQPNHIEALWQLGQLMAKSSQWDNAEKHFVSLIQLEPRKIEAREKLVELYETRILREMEELSTIAG